MPVSRVRPSAGQVGRIKGIVFPLPMLWSEAMKRAGNVKSWRSPRLVPHEVSGHNA